MKARMLMLAALVLLVAGSAGAADMTAEECMAKMQNCMACAPMAQYPQIGPNIRYNCFDTKSGFLSSFMIADEKVMSDFWKCEKERDVAREASMKLSAEEAGEKLCPFCLGMREIMAREDVSFENFESLTGKLMVASATTEEGTTALHAYAKMSRETSELLDEAMAEMMKKAETEGEAAASEK